MGGGWDGIGWETGVIGGRDAKNGFGRGGGDVDVTCRLHYA